MTLIFAKEYFIDKKCDYELSILSIVGILLKCKFSSFSTSINIRFIEETERGYTVNKK